MDNLLEDHFPIMKPMHATVAVLTALGTWNDVMTPLVIMSGTGKNTLPLAQLNFQTQFGTNYNLAFASYLLALLPILIFYLICQKHILNGVVNGAVKIRKYKSDKKTQKGDWKMGIVYSKSDRTFTIQTKNTTYQMQVDLMGSSCTCIMERKQMEAAWIIC